MTGEELNILSKIKVRPVEEQRDYLLEQNMLLTGKIATLEKQIGELKSKEYFVGDVNRQNMELQQRLFMIEGRLSLAKALLTQWLHGGDSNINIVSDTQRFLEVESEKV